METIPIGIDTPDLLFRLSCCETEIENFQFFQVPSSPKEDFSDLTAEEGTILQQALQAREGYGTPFWDAVLASIARSECIPRNLLSKVMRHNSSDYNVYTIGRKEMSSAGIREICSDHDDGHMVAVKSRVGTRNGKPLHIPMLDFHCSASDHGLALVQSVIDILSLTRFILESGKSYHFYGNTLIEESEFYSFLGRSLLFAPLVDKAWVAHQLIEGACALRVSSRAGYGGSPQVVACLV